ncbi:Thioredoxin-like protein [Dioscorea alata]|uniref:Thioredoxin-like protein n=2 Tax=Dioscorea alata TaxID=55571 RepID=A0ACB7WCP0_DIOAL|nr:Thioredoxin-like protein [Dioscorea alata]KAH7685581.1 Thioredoxin-like protein [Dioscorea alata]
MASSLSPPLAKALGSSSPPLRRPRRSFFSVSADIKESSSTSVSVSVANKEAGATEPVLSPPPGFKPPEPKPFTVGEGQILDIITASLALPLRFGSGTFVLGYSSSIVSPDEIGPDEYALDVQGKKVKETCKLGPRPEKPIEIYEFESCPFCRKVREMVSILDLDVLFYPCPRNGPNFRPKVLQMGGKQQFPYMVDPNTGVAMYESDNIIKYLADKYGDGTVPLMLSLGFLTTLTAGLAMLPRMGRGSSYLPAKLPPQPLVYWAYEGSPFCRLVREVLVELELPHLLRTVARGSPKRQELYKQASHFQAPYLEDPNTGLKMFESAAIVDYLKATYAQ